MTETNENLRYYDHFYSGVTKDQEHNKEYQLDDC